MEPTLSPCVSMWACVYVCTRACPHTQLILRNLTWRLWFLMSLGCVVPSGLPLSSHGPSPFRAIQIIYFDSFFSVRCLYSVVGIHPKLCTWLEDLRSILCFKKHNFWFALLYWTKEVLLLNLNCLSLSWAIYSRKAFFNHSCQTLHIGYMYVYACICMNVTYIYIWMWHTHTYICMYVTYIYMNVTQEVGRVPEDNHLSYCLYP